MKLTLGFLPLTVANLLLLTVVSTTILAYYYDHIEYIIPYISDTGTIPPESCIFGQILNIIWVLLSFAIYCKYLQVKEILKKHNMIHKNNLNEWTAIMGFVAAFGISIVANFQETNLFVVHNIGAVMTFGLGSLYLCMMTSLYLTITPVIGQNNLTKIRVIISALSMLTFLIFYTCSHIALYNFEGENILKWKKEDGGFVWHNVSAVLEWICASSIIVYILMMSSEFKSSTLYEPKIDVGVLGRNRA